MRTSYLSALTSALLLGLCHANDVASPFYIFSTEPLNLPTLHASELEQTPRDTIHRTIIPATLASCPTSQYLVVLQPGVTAADYDNERTTPFLARLANLPTGMKLRAVQGQVNVVAAVNTVLMDCLHHGVLHVNLLDTAHLDPDAANSQSESLAHAIMPAVQSGLTQRERASVLRSHDRYLAAVVDKLFGGEDYTLIYITEAADLVEDGEAKFGYGGGREAEVPLTGGD